MDISMGHDLWPNLGAMCAGQKVAGKKYKHVYKGQNKR